MVDYSVSFGFLIFIIFSWKKKNYRYFEIGGSLYFLERSSFVGCV